MEKFDFLSDPHIALKKDLKSYLPLKHENLIVCGDVCSISEEWELYVSFVAVCNSLYKRVFFVLGNHEYYTNNGSMTMQRINGKVKDLENLYSNFHVLLDEHYFLNDNTIIFGGTMWSFIGNGNATPNVPIYTYTGKLIDSFSWNQLFYTFMAKLTECIHNNPFCKFIIVTHYAPIIQNAVAPKFLDHYNNIFYCTDLEYFIRRTPNILIWTAGHTGYNFYQEIIHDSKHEECATQDLISERKTIVFSNQFKVKEGPTFCSYNEKIDQFFESY